MTKTGIVPLLKLLNFDYTSVLKEFIAIGDKTAIRTLKTGETYRKNYERGILLVALAQYFDLKRFLEFGTGRGYVCSCLSHLRPNMTRIVSVDQNDPASTYELIKSWNRGNVELIKYDTNKLTMSQISGKFDLYFIDSQHDGASVKKNYEFAKLTAFPKNIIVFDDYRNKFKSVKKTINALKFDQKILVHTDGWIIENTGINQSKDADKVLNGKEYESGMVIGLTGFKITAL